MKLSSLLVLAILLPTLTFSQNESPYKTSLAVDGPVIAGSLGLGYLGLKMIQNKDGLTTSELAAKSRDDVNGFDRFAAGNYSEKVDKASYYPFYASFAAPVLMLALDKEQGRKAGQVLVLFTESMAITGALFSVTAGGVNRSRPLVYSASAPLEKRRDSDSQRSFFAGHTAATATATFFLAKVFHDFNPDSPARPYVWAGAALVPAVMGYMRLEAGQHFLSDNLIGYAVGAGVGILVPQLHKKSANTNVTISPAIGPRMNGMSVVYTLKK